MLLQVDIASKGCEEWGPFGMVLALLIAAIGWLALDRKAIKEQNEKDKSELKTEIQTERKKNEELALQSIKLATQFEDKIPLLKENNDILKRLEQKNG